MFMMLIRGRTALMISVGLVGIYVGYMLSGGEASPGLPPA